MERRHFLSASCSKAYKLGFASAARGGQKMFELRGFNEKNILRGNFCDYFAFDESVDTGASARCHFKKGD